MAFALLLGRLPEAAMARGFYESMQQAGTPEEVFNALETCRKGLL